MSVNLLKLNMYKAMLPWASVTHFFQFGGWTYFMSTARFWHYLNRPQSYEACFRCLLGI